MVTVVEIDTATVHPRLGTRRSYPNKEEIRVHFERYWNEDPPEGSRYTIKEIAQLITEKHHLSVGEPVLKKWRKEWNLPRRYSSADEKKAVWEGVKHSETRRPSISNRGQRVPWHKIERWRKAEERKHGKECYLEKVAQTAAPNCRSNGARKSHIMTTPPIAKRMAFPDEKATLWETVLEFEDDFPVVEHEMEGADDELATNPGMIRSAHDVISFSSESHYALQGELDGDGLEQTFTNQAASTFGIPDRTICQTSSRHYGALCLSQDCIDMPLRLPDTMHFLDRAIRATGDFCKLYAGERTQLSSSSRWLLPGTCSPTSEQLSDLLSWRGYSKFYNGQDMFLVGNAAKGQHLMLEATEHMTAAFRKPSLRALSDILYSCFTEHSEVARSHLNRSLGCLIRTMKDEEIGLGPQHPAVHILEALCQFDPNETCFQVQMVRQLLFHALDAGMDDFDGFYDAKEQLIKLLIRLRRFDEALKESTELLEYSKRYAGTDCDDTYRAMRLEARIYTKMGLLETAECRFNLIVKRFHENRALYMESAAQKEWVVFEDFAELARRRGQTRRADHFTKHALAFSKQRYTEGGANTARILGSLLSSLSARAEWEEIGALSVRYPEAFETLSNSPIN